VEIITILLGIFPLAQQLSGKTEKNLYISEEIIG